MKVISASLSPNTEADDVWLAFRLLLSPWLWKKGAAAGKVESWFRQYFDTPCAISFNSGRSAELAILKAFGIGRGSEVIIQAFTCIAVPNSIRWAGATPVFADIDGSYNMDPADLERKITQKTKAVIVQHTFGAPADMARIIPIVKKHNLLLIEDCAHALGISHGNKKTGSFGDAAYFSFGRDKMVSSVFGGLAIISSKHISACKKLKEYHKKLSTSSMLWIGRQLFHPVAFSLILPLYTLGIGKAMLVLLQRMKLLSFPVYPEENTGRQPADFPAKYPNVLAILLLNQLKKLKRYMSQREKIVSEYGGKGALLRYPMQVDDPKRTIQNAKKYGIIIGNWYHNVVDPAPFGYDKGTCPRAEDAAAHIINLPTRISERDAKRVMAVL